MPARCEPESSQGAGPGMSSIAPFGYYSGIPLWVTMEPWASEFPLELAAAGVPMSIPSGNVSPPASATAGASAQPAGARSRVACSAIFAGDVLVVAVEVLLDVLGTGVGLCVVHPGASRMSAATGFRPGVGIRWRVSTIIALVFGCCVAARLAGVPNPSDVVLHGVLIWGVALLITTYLLTSAIGGAFSVVVGTLSAGGQSLKTAVPESGLPGRDDASRPATASPFRCCSRLVRRAPPP